MPWINIAHASSAPEAEPNSSNRQAFGADRPPGTTEPIRPIPRWIDHDRDKARLGRRLFGDPLLSLDRSVSCASCHDLDGGGHDPRPVSIGIQGRQGTMASPTVFNAVFNFRQFWNGRAADLREQARGPLTNPVEMGMSEAEIERRLNEEPHYRQAFTRIYGRPPNMAYLLDALAEFQRTLITPDSPFDLYLRGEAVLKPHQLQGYREFKELGCVTCHNGVNLGGNSFQKIGVIIPRPPPEPPSSPPEPSLVDTLMDLKARTGRDEDRFVFKVPTLRNIALTAPYFHDGSAADLTEALRVMAHHNLGVELQPTQIAHLDAFLRTLTGRRPDMPLQPEPGSDS